MKKLFLIVTAVVLMFVYAGSDHKSTPVIMEKVMVEEDNGYGMPEDMPEVRVMTYNIHRGINKDSELDLDGITEVIKTSGAEIVALQEVERFSVRTRFQDQIGYIADKLSMFYAFGKSLSILNGQYGNAILSKYPIEEYEVSELPSEGEKRTILGARLNVFGNRINFYSTHLGLDESERILQTEEIIRLTEDKNNVVISGDFNSKADKLGEITGRYYDCAGSDKDLKATFEAEGISERIDYIFVSDDFETKDYDVLESPASDHYPVTGVLKLIYKNNED